MKQNKHSIIKMVRILMLAVVFISICFFGLGISAQAKSKDKTPKPGWYMNKKGRVFYYNDKGKMLKKKKEYKIGKKYYYFDKNGMQRVGWIKYKGYYHYYNIAPKSKGYMVTNKTINGIKIDKKGRAVTNKNKAKILAKANETAFYITNFKMSQNQKNKACFMYIRDKTNWRNLTSFRSDLSDWDQYYATYAIFRRYGDCYTGGCGFAYMAAAVGSKNVYAASSGGHGWAIIDGYFYDPNWSWAMNNVNDYFKVPASLSGHGGRPDWARNGAYKKRVD
ncbi:MAG: hypothetical protein J5517_09805 [Eubacterium sp.]|nr:hypothetical protein [Eubacterium sp.]